MSTQVQAPQTAKSEVEFVPFGAESSIKLSINIIRNYIAIPTKSGKLPDERECMRFLMLCRSRRLNPFEGDCFLQGYDGRSGPEFSLITAHQAFLKRAEMHKEYDGMKSGVIVRSHDGTIVDREGDFTFDEDELLGAWATVYFKERKIPMNRRLKLKTFRKPYGRWVDDSAGMIVKCCEADALRSSFPTMLGGLYSAEEVGRYDAPTVQAKQPDMSDILPKRNITPTPNGVAPAEQGPAVEAKPEPPQPEPAKPAEPQPDNAAVAQGTEDATEALASIKLLAEQNGVNINQVISFCVANRLATKDQKLADLAGSKLVSLNKKFLSILPEIQKQPVS